MTVQIPLKKDANNDAERQGHVGYSSGRIYGDSDDVYVKNGDRVKAIFDQSFTALSSQAIANSMLDGRVQESGQINNPDFAQNSVSYSYEKDQVSNSIRSADLHNTTNGEEIKAPNVALPDSPAYVKPFLSSTSNGGFGNNAEEGSLHSKEISENSSAEDLITRLPDSIEILTKYQ
jgi:hypothetical protein